MTSNNWREATLRPDAPLSRALESLDVTGLQIVLVIDQGEHLLGTLTDGDIRRALMRGFSLDEATELHMNRSPITVPRGARKSAILNILNTMAVRSVPVVDELGRVVDLISLSDLIARRRRTTPAVIMAGGRGERLRPLTDTMPKPLVEIAGEPLIDIMTRRLVSHGFKEIWVTVHYLATEIKEHLGDGSHLGASVSYIDEDKPLGTAGSVRNVATEAEDTPILVCNVDNMHAVDFGALVDHHVSVGAWATLAVTRHVTKVPFGVVKVERGMVTEMVEKPERIDWVGAGVSVLSHRAMSPFPPGTQVDVPEVISHLLSRKLPTAAFTDSGYWLDVGTLDAMRQAQQELGGS